MSAARHLLFGPFRLDRLDERLWRGKEAIPLGRRALAMLAHLAACEGRLVTKDDLLDAAWPGTAVSEAALTTAAREIRRALGDRAREPVYVETVHGRGYRFVAGVTTLETWSPGGTSVVEEPEGPLVGREAERERLSQWLEVARGGERRVGFVAGEAGIGKTALVDAFLADTERTAPVLVGRGQCVEHHGAGEPFLPILEAMTRLAREAGERVTPVLRKHAPSWLAHVPFLEPDGEVGSPRPSPERMLRELAEAVEVLGRDVPLVLVIEDLHWADPSTVEWISYVARRRDPARFVVVATYRPVDAIVRAPSVRSLVAELRLHRHGGEIVLDYLSEDAVGAWLGRRHGDLAAVPGLASVLHRRTNGHPLFFVTIAAELAQRGAIASGEAVDPTTLGGIVPPSLRAFFELRIDRLPPGDREIVEAASVAGERFLGATVSAAIDRPEAEVEARCDALARDGDLLRAEGGVAGAGGTFSSRYRFRHTLFREVVYAGVPGGRRARLHARIGASLEAGRADEGTVASELARHFEEGRVLPKAVTYLLEAARRSVARSAYAEAMGHATRALALLDGLPKHPDRARLELGLELVRGQVAVATQGWGHEDGLAIFRRAEALAREVKDRAALLQAHFGLVAGEIVRAELEATRRRAEEILELALVEKDVVFRIVAHAELGGASFHLGELNRALEQFRAAEALYDPADHSRHLARLGLMDFGLFSRAWSTHALWYAGDIGAALEMCEGLLELTGVSENRLDRVVALGYATMLHQLLRDRARVRELAGATASEAREQGLAYYETWGSLFRGWSEVETGKEGEAVATMRECVATFASIPTLRLPYYRALLAEGLLDEGRVNEAADVLDDAFVDVSRSGERWWEPELHRLRGECLLRDVESDPSAAETAFRRAIDTARSLGTPILELRASTSLARRWAAVGKPKEARRLLEPLLLRLEGESAADIAAARALLDPRGGRRGRRAPRAVGSRSRRARRG